MSASLLKRSKKVEELFSNAVKIPAVYIFCRNLAWAAENNQSGNQAPLKPKSHLVQKYTSPLMLSASDRKKIELEEVRTSFKLHESDCGSSEVQIALLTKRIHFMAEHMKVHKKDLHSRKGLEAMLERRKKLLSYLRRYDWDSYCNVLSKLGLRDKAQT